MVHRALGVGRLSEQVESRDPLNAGLCGTGRGERLGGQRDAVRGAGGGEGVTQIRLSEHLCGLEGLILSREDKIGGGGDGRTVEPT